MKNILILIVLSMSNALMAASDVISFEEVVPDYLQQIQIQDALRSINPGESVNLELTEGSVASGDYFYAVNPVSYIFNCPSETAGQRALKSAEQACSSITGIGSIAKILNTNVSCNFTQIFMDRRNCECSASLSYTCKITKP